MKIQKQKSEVNYLYISSSLQDSFNIDGRIRLCFNNDPYKDEILSFLNRLSRLTYRGILPSKFEIIDGVDGEATQVRIIIRCPGDYSRQSFEKIALREWEKCKAADEIYLIASRRSFDMNLSFLRSDWKGSLSI